MVVEIINIGDELLLGQIINSNAAWMGQQMSQAGVELRFSTTVGDVAADIRDCLQAALARADGAVLTGGLGPTHDDITKKVVADYFGCPEMRTDDKVLAHIVAAFERRKIPIGQRNEEQALVPVGAKVLWNDMGTAPGLLFEKDGKFCAVLPGVPAEMKHLMHSSLLAYLKARAEGHVIRHRSIKTFGIPESSLANLLEPIAELEAYGKVAFLPSYSGVKLRLTVRGTSHAEVDRCLADGEALIKARAGKYVIGYDDDTLEGIIGQKLRSLRATLATAESCTGGLVASLITDVPGCSDYFLRGYVTYSNEAKTELLGVPEEILQQHGAVSEQCVLAMATGVRRVSGASYGLATTGIAGPAGGSEDKPVGLVWIAVATPQQTKAKRFLFTRERLVNKERFSFAALGMLFYVLREESGNG